MDTSGDAAANGPDAVASGSHTGAAAEAHADKDAGDSAAHDTWGFLKGSDNSMDGTPSTLKAWRETRRLQKWRAMLEDFPNYYRNNEQKVRSRIRKGIPDPLRGLIWQYLTGSKDFAKRKPEHRDLYKKLVSKETKHEDEILRDISRTFPKHIFFREKNGLGQRSLFNVLRAYSVYDEEVGYCQGMGFITGMFLLYMREEDAFWLLVSLMKNHFYGMEGMFKPKLPLLPQYLYIFEELLREQLPRLAEHYEQENVNVSMYMSQWFITVFLYSFPFAVVLRIWDIFISEGVKIVFRVSLAIHKELESTLLGMSMEQVLLKLKSHPKKIKDPDALIRSALKIKLSSRHLEKLAMEYKSQRGEVDSD